MRFKSDCAQAASDAKTIEQTARREQPRPDDFEFVREKREQQPHETVNAHFRKHTGQNHRSAGGRAFICVGQPGVKREERNLDCEPEKDSGEGEPRGVAMEQASFSKSGEFGEIESSPNEINSEKRKQHRDAAEKGVEEKLRRGAVAIFAAPDFDEQECGDEAHLVKQKPQNKILRGERAVERGLHDEHERAEPAIHSLREKRERKNERGQQDEKQAQAIDADEIFRAD